LPAAARRLVDDPRNQPVFSAANLWEVALKAGLGRGDFHIDARLLRRGLLDNGYDELAITDEHAVAIGNLPPIHRDPILGRRHLAADHRPDRRPIPRSRAQSVRRRQRCAEMMKATNLRRGGVRRQRLLCRGAEGPEGCARGSDELQRPVLVNCLLSQSSARKPQQFRWHLEPGSTFPSPLTGGCARK
jgi:hypothetical protein